MSDNRTLTEALADLGITHRRSATAETDGTHDWFDRDGNLIGSYDAHEGWTVVERMRDAEPWSLRRRHHRHLTPNPLTPLARGNREE